MDNREAFEAWYGSTRSEYEGSEQSSYDDCWGAWQAALSRSQDVAHDSGCGDGEDCGACAALDPKLYGASQDVARVAGEVEARAKTVHRRIDALCEAANTPDADYFDASSSMLIATRDLLIAIGHPHSMDSIQHTPQPPQAGASIQCKTCGGSCVVDDGEITGSGGFEFENGPIKCVKDCPDCAPAAPAVAPSDEEIEDATLSYEAERAVFNSLMRWHLVRMLQAWRYGGNLNEAGMAAFEWARANNVGQEAFKASGRAAKIAAPAPAEPKVEQFICGMKVVVDPTMPPSEIKAVFPKPEQRAATLPDFTSPLTPYGLLVRALRIVAGTNLHDMSKALLTTPAKLSAMEFGRAPITEEFAFDVSAYFDALGVPDTLAALKVAILAAHNGGKHAD